MDPFTLMMIGMGAGAAAGGISTLLGKQREGEQIELQKRYAQEAYQNQTAYNQKMWNLQKGEALETLGIAKNRLAQAFDADVAGFNLGLEGQALQSQDARIALADNAGAALAAQGASGVKGNDGLQRRLEYAESSFARQMDLQERGNSLAMQGMARQYTNQFADIGREVDSWGAGGYKYQANELGKAYAKQTHDLQMQGYKDAKDDINNPNYVWADYLTGIFGGAGSGARFGAQVGAYTAQSQAPQPVGGWDWRPSGGWVESLMEGYRTHVPADPTLWGG